MLKIDPNIEYFGTLLPSGNAAEFPLIRDCLKNLGVNYQELTKNGGVLFFFDKNEICKLPSDDTNYKIKQYLPVTENSGHSIYSVNNLFSWMKK